MIGPAGHPCAPCPKTEAGTEGSPGRGGSEQCSQPQLHIPNSWGTTHHLHLGPPSAPVRSESQAEGRGQAWAQGTAGQAN